MAVEFQTRSISFPSAKGAAQSKGETFTFSAPVVKAVAAIQGFSIGFTNGDRPLFKQEVDLDVTVKAGTRDVWVTVKFALRDASGTFDDPFEGRVEVVVIAETLVVNIPCYIHDGDKVALRGSNGMWVSVQEGAGRKLVANWPRVENEQKFTVEIIDNLSGSLLTDRSRLALRDMAGNLVCAEGGGGKELVANRQAIGPWESFAVKRLATDNITGSEGICDGDTVVLLACNEQFVCGDAAGAGGLAANALRVTSKETFVIFKV